MVFKLGLNPSIKDRRTIQLESVLSDTIPLPPLPESYSVDKGLGFNFTESVFGNDKYGDCVIAGRANHTLRFEYCSQNKQIPITTDDVVKQYWLEQGYVPSKCALLRALSIPPDNGLNMLDSLKSWKNKGWYAAGNKYDISAFLQIPVGSMNAAGNPPNPDVVKLVAKYDKLLKYAIFLLNGAMVGVNLPKATLTDFNNGKYNWEIPQNKVMAGGHCIYFEGFDTEGWLAHTWGKKVHISYEWWHMFGSESFAVVDNKNSFLLNDSIDLYKLNCYLNSIALY
jgi:hypothetical protein